MNQPQSVFFSLRVLKFITILQARLCSKKNYSRQPSALKLWNPRCDVQGKTGLSLLLGDRRFIEEKTYWMHKQNDEFMQRDKCIPQISVECRTREKNINLFHLVSVYYFCLNCIVHCTSYGLGYHCRMGLTATLNCTLHVHCILDTHVSHEPLYALNGHHFRCVILPLVCYITNSYQCQSIKHLHETTHKPAWLLSLVVSPSPLLFSCLVWRLPLQKRKQTATIF